MIAGFISLIAGVAYPDEEHDETRETGWLDGAAIFLAVIVVSTVTAGNDWTKDLQFRELEKERKQ